MEAKQVNKVFMQAIGGSPKRRASTPAQKRRLATKEKIELLERLAAEIRNKARETPAWSKGYFSAIATIEMEIQRIRNGI